MNTADIEHFSSEAVRLMRKHVCAPTPHNYALWYHYACRKSEGLAHELDAITSQGARLDEATSEYLYHKYVETPSVSLEEPEVARTLLADILRVINAASSETQVYHREIDGHIAELESHSGGEGAGDLTERLSAILGSALGLKQSGETLQNSLDDAMQEIETLRRNLQDATNEAQRDFLTGLFNRKAFDRLMDELTGFAHAQDAPLSLLMVDVDHFKRFNDQFGHLIGDEVLKMVARMLKDTVKGTDVVARFGGEEFAIILPHTPLVGARVVAENIRRTIASKELKHKDRQDSYGCVTVSIGIASVTSADTVPLLIKRADDALFAAKHAGRNCVSSGDVASAA